MEFTEINAVWQPNPKFPNISDFKVADIEIDGEKCKLEFVDRVAPSGRRYISVTVQGAPHQGRGKQLCLTVNGVPLVLSWNGSNRPRFPRTATHCNYRRERLTPEHSKRLQFGQRLRLERETKSISKQLPKRDKAIVDAGRTYVGKMHWWCKDIPKMKGKYCFREHSGIFDCKLKDYRRLKHLI